MRAALYARVSTENQSVAMQMADAREYAKRRGWEYLEFTDVASGATKSRPQLDAMLATARRRGIDVVVVWKFDRFARSVSHLVRALEEFKALGIGFVSLTEQIDTTTPAGELVFHVMAAIAQFERELTRERVKAGLAHARANGKRLGRPVKGTVELVPEILAMRKAGRKWAEIEKELSISRRTASRLARGAGKTQE